MNYQVVTFMDKIPAPHFRPDWFFCTCKRYGVAPIVLGQGIHWSGNREKIRLLREAIQQRILTAPILIVVDAFDVVFATHPSRIASSFAVSGHQLIFNAETFCYPPSKRVMSAHPKSPTRLRFLNSGFMVGYTETILMAIRSMEFLPWKEFFPYSEQYLWQLVFMKKEIPIYLDRGARFCLACYDIDPRSLDVVDGRMRFRKTGATPMAFHFNGPSKWKPVARKVLNHLNLQ